MAAINVTTSSIRVPFFRPILSDAEIGEVTDTLRSGWLTTGPKVKRFELEFAAAVRADHAVALNSCTAALHLAVEALKLRPGQVVMIPAMTFAATAEVVRYQGAIPLLVDCDCETLNMDLEDAARKLEQLRAGKSSSSIEANADVVGVIPVHVGGMMINIAAVKAFARQHGLWIVEDAAHAFPAAWRPDSEARWQRCGEGTADVTCFSFYANKTITTGEGGMAVTERAEVADRMRMMSLHGLTQDAWNRYATGGTWDYKIGAPGFKYNLTDIAAAIGIHQLARSEEMRREREAIAVRYTEEMAGIDEVELPPSDPDRVHAWHLFPLRLRLESLSIDRNTFIEELKRAGICCSVHWRPLHLHPYYIETFGWCSSDFPIASAVWQRLISLPIFPGMLDAELEHVVSSVRRLCRRYVK
jgi:perosamine synthetase